MRHDDRHSTTHYPPPTTHHPRNKLAESSWHITDQKFRPFRRGMAGSFPRRYMSFRLSRPVCPRVAKARLTTREPISIVGVIQCTARGQCNTHKTSTSTSALLPPRQRRSHFRNSIYRQRPVHDVFALHLPSTTALPINEQPPVPCSNHLHPCLLPQRDRCQRPAETYA